MLYVTWSMAERPTPFTPTQYFVRSLVAAFLFIFTEIVDDLDGCHARKTNQCSKLGEVLDHLVDAMGIPVLSVSIAFALQYDHVGVAAGVACCLLMFNFQLVLYQRSGCFVMPPISGPRGSVLGCICILIAGILISQLGREHWVATAILTAINFGATIGVIQNMGFYLQRIAQNDRQEIASGKVAASKGIWSGILGTVLPTSISVLLFSALYLAQYSPTWTSYFYGLDMVQVQWTQYNTRAKWFTPMAYVLVMIGISFFINGGMVVNAVLKRPHSNFHFSIVIWLLLHLGVHMYQVTSDPDGSGLVDQYAWILPYACTLSFFVHTIVNFCNIMSELEAYNTK